MIERVKRNIRYGNPWFIIIIIILALSFLFMLISNYRNKQLDVYNQSDQVSQYEYTEEKKDISMYSYENKEDGYSLQIPNDWDKIEEDCVITFIHKPSASSIKITGQEYDPSVNILNETDLSNQVSSDGHSFVSFKYQTTSSYELIYQDQQANVYDYMDEVFWNRERQVNLLCTFSDKNYEKIIPYYQAILESFKWSDESLVINDAISIVYLPEIHTQFGIPDSWQRGIQDNLITGYDEESGTNFFFSCEQMNHKQLNGTDVSNYLNNQLNNFVMNSYEGDTEKGHAICSYVQDDVQYMRNAYIFAKDNLVYFMVYDYQNGMLDESIPDLCKEYFQIFPAKEDSSEPSNSDITEESTSSDQVTESEESTVPADDSLTDTSEQTTQDTEESVPQTETDQNEENPVTEEPETQEELIQ